MGGFAGSGLARRTWLGCVVAVALTSTCASAASAAERPLTGNQLLTRLVDPVAASEPLPEAARVIQRSSHEREGGNRDWGVWSGREGRPQTFVRREEGGYVLLDEQRPGCLTRMWFTTGPVAVTEIANIGRLQLFFNGESEPRLDVPADEFFAGRSPGFPQPLVGDGDSSSGGHFANVPFCFERSLKVRISAVPDDEQVWYQLTALVLPHRSLVETFRPGELKTGPAADALGAAGQAPTGEPVVAEKLLGAGDRLPLIERSGAGSIRFMRFAVTPFTAETLAGLDLRVTVDGAAGPQIEVPLGALFGDGLSARAVRSLAFGMDPVAGTGYFSLPIPFEGRVSAEVRSRTSAQVRAETWTGTGLPGAGRLHGQRWVEHSQRGGDFTALAATGSGRLAAWVLDLIGAPGSDMGPVQFFLEGDERVHVDGSRSPSVYGTGTEDAFNGGFYYSRGPFSLPTHGAGIPISRGDTRGARSQYRVFGGDGFLWEDGIRFDMEHGGGDERDDEITASTAFWYQGASRLHKTDELAPDDARSRSAHSLRGPFTGTRLNAYFEGERDGNGPDSPAVQFGGTSYPAPPPEQSPEAVTASGIAFSRPVSFDLRVGSSNCGVILRRQLDAGEPGSVYVTVNRRRVGPWPIAEVNPAKRWLSDDFQIHPRFTAGKRRIRVTLTPQAGTTATAFSVRALARRSASCVSRPRAARIRLKVRPRVARAGTRTRFVFQATVRRNGRRRPARGAVVRFAGRRVRTNRRGRVRITRRIRGMGRRRACARKRGLRGSCVRVRIVQRRGQPAARTADSCTVEDPQPVANADCVGVRPGAFLRVDGGFCTLGFLLQGSDGARYMTTAGHCALPNRADRGRDIVFVEGQRPKAVVDGVQIGEVVYAVQDDLRDIALVRLDAAIEASPEVIYWGGPVGLYTDHSPDPVTLRHVGNGVFVGNLWNKAFGGFGDRDVRLASARTAVAADTLSAYEVLADGAASVGDSGSPVMDERGRAVGVLAQVGRTGTDTGPAAAGVLELTRLDYQLPIAGRILGIDLTLFTAPVSGGCTDRMAPRSAIRRLRVGRRGFRARGVSHDPGCITAATRNPGAVAAVRVAVGRRVGRRCRFVARSRRLTRRRSCRRPIMLRARTRYSSRVGATAWRIRRRRRLPAGIYFVRVRARDSLGNSERPGRSARVRVRA